VDLIEAMTTTAAVRAFTDEPVPDAVVHRVLDHARFAGSGGNRQGWRVIVVHDPGIRAELRDLYRAGWREYMAHVRAGLVPFAPGPDGRWTGPAVDLAEAARTPAPNDFADHLDAVPVLLVVAVRLGALACIDNGLDRQLIVGGASIYPFVHNILLAARNEGLGGVLTTVLCRREPQAMALLGIPEGWAVAALLALGHPQHQPTRLTRRPVEEMAVRDRFDGPPFQEVPA
jgi:nitroreductase